MSNVITMQKMSGVDLEIRTWKQEFAPDVIAFAGLRKVEL